MPQEAEVQEAERIEQLAASREAFLAFLRNKLSEDMAEDTLQDSLLKAISSAPQLRDKGRLLPWFHRVLHNSVVDVYRRKGAALAQVDVAFALDVPVDSPEHRTACECFRQVLPTLKPEYADLIEMIDLQRRSAAKEAARLGITAAN